MSYKIAIASSDEITIDQTFGAATGFHIYEVTDTQYKKLETRTSADHELPVSDCSVKSGSQSSGCHSGECHPGGGCFEGKTSAKVELVTDCRCVVCKKIGFSIQKQLERKAITAFDVSCTVEEALNKITAYFYKIDTHQSLRK